jgi:hypothetical protein
MARVYSQQLFFGAVGPNQVEAFTAQEGYVTIIRDVTAGIPFGDQEVLLLFVNGASVMALGAQYAGAGDSGQIHFNGRLVLAAGQVVTIACSQDATAIVSGYTLTTT